MVFPHRPFSIAALLGLGSFFSIKCVVANRDFTFLSLTGMRMGMETVDCGDGWDENDCCGDEVRMGRTLKL